MTGSGALQATSLLELDRLTVEFSNGRNRPPLRAVDDVSLQIASRETVGLVGESGSGKTTLGRAVLGLVRPTMGTIRFLDNDITHATFGERRRLSADLQAVFQDPYSSLNPTRTIAQTLSETLQVHRKQRRGVVAAEVLAMLERVGLSAEALSRYPRDFSGGQRQRIAIARALLMRPKLVICDEPVSALDLSVQAQVLNLLRELQNEFELSYLFIAHDLDVVRHLSHRIVVLYRGRVMEEGAAALVHETPVHPYTRMLLDAAPVPDPDSQRQRRQRRAQRVTRVVVVEENACPFVTRCPHATTLCETQRPPLGMTPDGRQVACHHWRELSAQARDSLPSAAKVN